MMGISAIKANISVCAGIGRILRSSLGPNSMDKIIQDTNGDITITNDGATILEKINIENPIGKLLVEFSKSQEFEIGDGTTGVIVLGIFLLESAEVLINKGVHPLRISLGYETACRVALNHLDKISCKFEFRNSDVNSLIHTSITTLSSKIVGRCKRILAEICVRAVLAVADIDRKEVNLELIKVDGKVGGKIEHTNLIFGVTLDKEMSHPQMDKHITNAKIAILTCPFEPPKPKTKHRVDIETTDQFETLNRMESNYFINMVNKCKHAGATFIVCQWGFDDEPNHLLMSHNLPAVRWVSGVDIELISMATGARFVPRFEEMTSDKLGYAKVVREVSIGTDSDKVIFIEGFSQSGAVTLLVRGGSKLVVDETKRSLHDALCVIRNLIKANSVVYGGGSAEISCSLAIREAAVLNSGVEQYAILAFADALEQIPQILAENSGLNPIEILKDVKVRQITEKNPFLGVDCHLNQANDMRTQNVFETLIGKKHQLISACQLSKTILKIDDVILHGEKST
jgi:T-complex protein 1 subunit epsilon